MRDLAPMTCGQPVGDPVPPRQHRIDPDAQPAQLAPGGLRSRSAIGSHDTDDAAPDKEL
jgi:hypothetical protein